MLLEAIKQNFTRIHSTISNNILLTTECMMRCASSNTSRIARELARINKGTFKTNDMWLYRFLDNKKFQVDDNLWRCYINSIFDMLLEQKEIKGKGDQVNINIDFTSDRDDFLILCASVMLGDSAVPLYFSMRKYPRRKN